jgi:integrase
MQRRIRFVRREIEKLLPCPADNKGSEVEFTSAEAPPGLRLVVTKRGAKSWLYRYTIRNERHPDGMKRAVKLGVWPGMEATEACARALELRGLIARGIDPLEVRDDARNEPTLDQFFQEVYFPHAKATLRSAPDVESRWRLHIRPVFGGLKFRELKTAGVMQFHDRKKLETTPATANRLLALLKRVLNVAMTHELCERNPAVGVRMHPEMNIRDRTLSGEELRRFLAALKEEPNQVAAAYMLFAVATAARREECLQMTWDELNLEERVWRIPAVRSKNGKSRIVPLSDIAMMVLDKRPRLPGNGYVFVGRNDGHLCNPSKALRRVMTRAGIVDLKLHDLRRSAATLIVNNGGDISMARNLLGHSSSTVTATRYAFLSDARTVEASRLISSVLAEALEPVTPS